MSKHTSSPNLGQDLSRLSLLLRVSGVYLCGMLGLIYYCDRASLLMVDAAGTATLALKLVHLFYYVVPILLAATFGILFRPLGQNFLKVYSFLLIVQFSASLVGYGFREQIIRLRRDDLGRSHLAILRFSDFRHTFRDVNKDGRMDQMVVSGKLFAENLSPGAYTLEGSVIQDGIVLPHNPVVSLRQEIASRAPRHFRIRFAFNPQVFNQFFGRGDLEIWFSLHKSLALSSRDRQVLRWAQFLPFLRTVPWGKEDPLFQSNSYDLDVRHKIDAFQLLPIPLNGSRPSDT